MVSHTMSPNPVVSLSAEGTRDWFAPGGTTNPNFYHAKLRGGQIMKSFDWVIAGQNLTYQGSSFNVNSMAADDFTGLALSSQTDPGVFTGVGATGFGFRLRVPAGSSGSRTLKVYGSAADVGVTLTAHLSDGSVADVRDIVDTGTGSGFFVWTITYQSAYDGEELEISAVVTTSHGSSGNFKFTAATLQ